MQSSIERTVSGVRCTNDDLKPVLVALATDQPLDVRYRDHDLSGDWAGYRECYIKPDLRHCCKVSDEAAFCLIQRPYISKTLLTRRISPRGSP
ncbi:type II toxin-antitoxin system YafQ family toxin [Enterobacter hormaechei]|uniref:type II toxin-antitoxin system YafQ family toxin n=1 Tax=Enterobacter hormaechei TaxID=158836 RepID=UPI0038FD2062